VEITETCVPLRGQVGREEMGKETVGVDHFWGEFVGLLNTLCSTYFSSSTPHDCHSQMLAQLHDSTKLKQNVVAASTNPKNWSNWKLVCQSHHIGNSSHRTGGALSGEKPPILQAHLLH